MNNALQNSRGESLVSIIVGIFILSIIIFGIASLLATNSTVEDESARNATLALLEQNASAVLRTLDTSLIPEKEIFFIQKDIGAAEFRIHTGAPNIGYAYINAAWDYITNTGSTTERLYYRSFSVDQSDTALRAGSQVIKGTLRELVRRAR